jgi:phosphoserine aminotransferase
VSHQSLAKNPCKFNFSAGPSMLPSEVMKKASAEFLNWNNTGMSVMEMSHRGKEYMSIFRKTEQDLRKVFQVPKKLPYLIFTRWSNHSKFYGTNEFVK